MRDDEDNLLSSDHRVLPRLLHEEQELRRPGQVNWVEVGRPEGWSSLYPDQKSRHPMRHERIWGPASSVCTSRLHNRHLCR